MRNRAKLDLRLNLSPPRRAPAAEAMAAVRVGGSPGESSGDTSSPSSCLSSEDVSSSSSPSSSSPVKGNSPAAMVVAGCSRCLMYVMVLENDLRCPRCRSNVLLDLLCNHDKKKKSSK